MKNKSKENKNEKENKKKTKSTFYNLNTVGIISHKVWLEEYLWSILSGINNIVVSSQGTIQSIY